MLARLRRITTSGSYVPEIDGLRFIAIAAVVLFHLLMQCELRSGNAMTVEPGWRWLSGVVANGERGVRLFFVISGMILAMPFARHLLIGDRPVRLGKYYMRRLTRLEPPYVLSIVFAVLLLAVYRGGLASVSTGHLFATLTYQHNLVYGEASPINPVTWSLEVEIEFYILAPLLMQLFRIRPLLLRRGLLVVLIATISAVLYFNNHSMQFERSIFNYIQYFLAGLLVADCFVLDLNSWRSHWLWDLVGFASLGVAFWIPSYQLGHALLPAVFGVLVLAGMRSFVLRRLLSHPWVCITGGMCYSIYLLHFLLIATVFKMSRHAILHGIPFFANFAVQALLIVPVVLAISALFFLAIERPCMDPQWPDKLRGRVVLGWRKLRRNRAQASADEPAINRLGFDE